MILCKACGELAHYEPEYGAFVCSSPACKWRDDFVHRERVKENKKQNSFRFSELEETNP